MNEEPKKKRSLKRKIAIVIGICFLAIILIFVGLFTFFLIFVYQDIQDGILVDKRDPKYLPEEIRRENNAREEN